jgi:hypothetical protein
VSPDFDGFVAIDWSGARGPAYRGVAVAQAAPGTSGPVLVPVPGGGKVWTRTAVLDWLDRRFQEGGRLLVGFDFAFSLPWDTAGGYFADPEAGVFDLWDRVEAVCAADADLFGGAFAADPEHGAGFWMRGPLRPDFTLARRATEAACRADGLGTPDSPYKLIGARQVGKGALAGMRLLLALRRRHPKLRFWPFDRANSGSANSGAANSGSVLVEIYPRLFLKLAGWGAEKVRTAADLDRCLDRLGSGPASLPSDAPGRPAPTDHETDALVSAAGLRRLAGDPAVWDPPGLDGRARRKEGWIFGVGAGLGSGHPLIPRATKKRGGRINAGDNN